ncbi:unnamed protein product [Acanthoscelides obtectus]|uniref:Uncharacterized protein n=1 Tax=Acanthoscelides obtectus TaxID=200917 RepID=A0A9P0P7Q3_ACAOB|nr:unnamed protein product [Acanthoscelides obtectus]CAK1681650.1 hypothetical protein AOBTE_LOCUS33190 [Acanthoscelides obtectus]
MLVSQKLLFLIHISCVLSYLAVHLYLPITSFRNQINEGQGWRLQKIFDDETRLIRAQTASLLRRIHDPVPRVKYTWPCPCPAKYVDNGLPARLTNDYYINKMLTSSSINPNVSYTTYYTEPIRRYIGSGHLSCTAYSGGMPYSRRSHLFLYEDPMRNDIQLLSFYINKFKQEKAMRGEAPAIESSKVKKSEQRSAKVEKHESIDKSETTDEKPVITEVSE